MVKISEFHNHESIQLLLNELLGQRQCCGNTLIRLTLHKFTDGDFGKSTEGKENKFISRVKVSSNGNKVLPLPMWKWSSPINVPPGGYHVLPENSAMSEAQS